MLRTLPSHDATLDRSMPPLGRGSDGASDPMLAGTRGSEAFDLSEGEMTSSVTGGLYGKGGDRREAADAMDARLAEKNAAARRQRGGFG